MAVTFCQEKPRCAACLPGTMLDSGWSHWAAAVPLIAAAAAKLGARCTCCCRHKLAWNSQEQLQPGAAAANGGPLPPPGAAGQPEATLCCCHLGSHHSADVVLVAALDASVLPQGVLQLLLGGQVALDEPAAVLRAYDSDGRLSWEQSVSNCRCTAFKELW